MKTNSWKFFLIFFASYLLLFCFLPAEEKPLLVIEPRGHSAMINEVMFTPDGRVLISVSDDKTIRLWDVESGELLKTLRGQVGDGREGMLYAGALSPDGRTLAVGGYLSYNNDGEYGRIRLMDIETGEQVGLLKGHSDVILALAFSADGQWLASGSGDYTVRIWEVGKTMAAEAAKDTPADVVLEGHTAPVYGVAFAPDSRRLVSASYDHTLRLWQQNTRGQFDSANFIPMKKHSAEVTCVAWSPDGQYIVSGGFDDKILLWDGNGNFIKEIAGYSGNVYTVSFSRDSKKVVAVGGGTYEAVVYAIPSGSPISRFTRHKNTVLASDFFGSDLIATAGGADNDIYIWQADTAAVKTHLVGQGKMLWAAAFGQGLQVAFGQEYSYVDDSNLGPLQKSFDFSNLALDSEASKPGAFTRTSTTYAGKTLERQNAYELQVGPGIAIKNDKNTYERIRCYTFTPDGKVIVGSSFSLKLYGNDGAFIREFTGHTGEVLAVSVSGDGRLLASAGSDQTLKLWNIATGELLATLFVSRDNQWICWTPRGYYAASAGGEHYMGWHVNRGIDKEAEYYPVYSFKRQYFKPGLVRRTIELFSFEKALAEYDAGPGPALRVTPAPQVLPPRVEWLDPVTYRQKATSGTLRLRALITSEIEITDFKILVGGRTAAIKSEIALLDDSTATRKNIECTVPLTAGENRITIFAANRDASATSSERLVNYENTDYLKPNLYVVSIGISAYEKPGLKLEYADDDANAVSRLLATQKGLLFKGVSLKTLADGTATQANIIADLEWLEQNVTQKDVAVVFIAGHGRMEKGNYYVLPHEGDPDSLRRTAVSWHDFTEILGNLPAKVLLCLDTCQSGGIDPVMLSSGFRDTGTVIDNTEAIRELASEENGVIVMAASTARELSQEHSDWGHGAFTQAIIEGLEQGKADYNGDGIIYLTELDTYVSERVKELTKGKQHPTTQKPAGVSRFPLFQIPPGRRRP